MATNEKVLQQYPPGEVNMLVPAQHLQQVSPWHAARTSVVLVNPDPNAGDVFKVGSRWNEQKRSSEDLYCLGKPALMRIAAAAGIVWNWRESGPVVIQRDYILYKAIGAVRLPDGSWQPIVAEKEIDLAVIEEELRDQYTKKADGPLGGDAANNFKGEWREITDGEKKRKVFFLAEEEKPRYVEANVRSNLIQWRKNKLMRAETGAMLRVIRAALGIKAQYTKEELQKPFVVPRIDFSPDYSDPAVRQALIEHGVRAMANLFGQVTPAPQAMTPYGPFSPEHPALTAPPIQAPMDGDEENGWREIPEPADETAEAVQEVEAEAEPEPEPEAQQAPEPEPEPQPPMAGQSRLFNGGEEGGGVCAACGKKVSKTVAAYSLGQYKKVFCYKCQKEVGGR